MFLIELIKAVLLGLSRDLQNGYRSQVQVTWFCYRIFVQFKNQDPAFMEMFNVRDQLGAILQGCGDLFR